MRNTLPVGFGVIPTGFEPVADRLEICCSIQLSYGTIGCKSNISDVGFQIGSYLCLCKKNRIA